MIAIHSALYIFKARSSGEGDLYPYRRIAYTIWATFPVAMASLAFINDGNAYTGAGTYCYTPVRPLWYRLALSWIPRYLVFITIVGIYASIYFYVRRKFSGFTKLRKDNSIGSIELEDHSDRSPRSPRSRTAPAMPALARHGLILDSRHPSLTGTESERYLALTVGSHKHLPISPQTNVHRFMWASFIARSDRTPIQMKSPPTQDPYPRPVASGAWPSYRPDNLDHVPSNSGRSTITKRSMVDIFTVLSHGSTEIEVPMPISKLRFVNSSGQNVAVTDMIHTRDNIRRQLRFLFIYPLVYLGMWIVPFVCHALQYDDRFATNLPFGLSCTTTVFLSSQAAVDCCLFSSREKPWRYIQGTDGSFSASLKFWSGWKKMSENKTVYGPGRTRDEMVRDARAAYRRRDEELAERRTDASQTEQIGDDTTSGVEMAWWESMALDGTMRNSVADELSKLRDDVVTTDSSSVDSEAPLNGAVMAHLQEQNIREEE
jgi:G protein-coupled receptor GPR1